VIESKFFEKDFWSTGIAEIEFVRSPFYDLAKGNNMSDDEVHAMIEEVGMKAAMVDDDT
jgi:hypothetical protein